MIERILVGVDGSAGASAATAWAASAALSLNAEVTVVAVADAQSTSGGSLEDEQARIQAGLDADWCGPLGSLDAASTVVEHGDPREVLMRLSEQADLVVVGSTGTGWFPAVHLGHVGHYLASHANMPTVVVPPQARPPALDCLVVGIDGSPGSTAAIEFARSVMTRPEQMVVGANIHIPVARAGHRIDEGDWRSASMSECERWMEPLASNGLQHEIVIDEGHPAQALAGVARAERAGAVVVGTKGHGNIAGVNLGTVALRLLQMADGPVIVTPPTMD